MWELEFMERYNALLSRYKKAEDFLSSSTYKTKQGVEVPYKSLEEEIKHKEKWLKEFHKLVRELSLMMQEYKNKTGQAMNQEDINNGFIL